MNEAQRQFLLGVAGVRVWYARSPLPGSAPSPEFRFPEPEPVESFATGGVSGIQSVAERRSARPARDRLDQAAAEKGARRIAGLQQLIAGDTEPKPSGALAAGTGSSAPVAPQSPLTGSTAATRLPARNQPEVAAPKGFVVQTEVPTRAGGADEGRPEGHWGIWRARDWCLVSDLAAGASRALEHRLALAILAAVGDEIVEQRELRWPVFSHPELPGSGPDGFRDTLERLGKSLGLVPERPGQLLYLDGREDAGVPPELLPERSGVGALLATVWGAPCCRFQGSLAALAAEPALKRSLWGQLRPLVTVGPV